LVNHQTMPDGSIIYFPHPVKSIPFYSNQSQNLPHTPANKEQVEEHVALSKLLQDLKNLPTTEELKNRVATLEKQRDQMVLSLWQQNASVIEILSSRKRKFDRSVESPVLNVKAMTIDQEEHIRAEKIRLLNEYNKVRDNAHYLLGLLAEKKGCTVASLYNLLKFES